MDSGSGSNRRTQSRLNLPAGKSPNSLQLDTGRTRLPSIIGPPPPSPSTPSPSKNPYVSSPSRVKYSDRFIPSRSGSRLHIYSTIETKQNAPEEPASSPSSAAVYSAVLKSELFGPDAIGPSSPITPDNSAYYQRDGTRSPLTPSVCRNLFRFKSESPRGHADSPYSESPIGSDFLNSLHLSAPPKPPRKINRSPYKVLDAPALQDDFYLNLVDWSSQNVLAVGLGTCVYLWNATSSKVTKLCDLGPADSVCSLSWSQQGHYVAVGTNIGEVQVWDAVSCTQIRSMGGHTSRAGAMAWNSHILSSGGRDRNVYHRDIRSPNNYLRRLIGHKSEVCGLKWSYDDRELASGGNDNQLLIWNVQYSEPMLKFCEHTAAVKAITWSPHQHGLLASGGGTADRCIRFWNTTTNARLNCVDTGSQVCNLIWCKNVNELVSTHGYSQNQIMVWRYPSMTKLATLTGHTLRVLYLSISPDGQTIVTGAGDETLRFWNIFPSPKSRESSLDSGLSSFPRAHIR